MKAKNINKENNFDFLRLLFASLVIISHSFPLTGNDEIFETLTCNQISLGSLSVNCFFIMSGYLIYQSMERSKTWISYIWKRILRLFPALIVLMFITLCILPFVYHGDNIFKENSYWTYLPNGLSLYKIQYNVNGVFKNNPYPNVINGSLWSLSYEFTQYICILFLFPIRKAVISKIVIITVFIAVFLLFLIKPLFMNDFLKKLYLSSELLYKVSSFFLAGVILSFCNLKTINTFFIRVGLFFLITISLFFNFYKYISPIALPILVILLATLNTSPINSIAKYIGDISYGVYIYGFLVQQLLMYYFKLNILSLLIISPLITFIVAYFSWHFIEKRSLKYKNLL